MTLARAWRRQVLGASGVALIVPSAMLAALAVLALGGGLRSVGVLGQVFAGPPAPSGASLHGGRGAAASSIPVIPAAGRVAGVSRSARPLGPGGAGPRSGGAAAGRTGSPGSSAQTGAAINASGGPVSVVTRGSAGAAAPGPAPGSPSHPVSLSPSPSPPPPQPSPQPTVVDQVVKVVTPVTSALPAPVGPPATNAVQSAGSAGDSLLPPPGSSLP